MQPKLNTKEQIKDVELKMEKKETKSYFILRTEYLCSFKITLSLLKNYFDDRFQIQIIFFSSVSARLS